MHSRRAETCLRSAIEALEPRKLLCTTHLSLLPPAPRWSDAIEEESRRTRLTEGGPEAIDIVWTNRNDLSGASDNFFDDAFGTSYPAAQAVVDAAIQAWERVITNFNRGDGTNTLQVAISIARDGSGNLVGGFGGGGGPAASAPTDGKPRTGSITINAGNIVPNTPDDSNGYYFDPRPDDYAEFQGAILNPFAGAQTTNQGGELFSVVAAELTHVLGLISPKTGQGGANFNGYRLISSGLTQATGQRDNAEGGNTSGFFYVFNGPSVSHAMTSFNSGDGDSDSWGNVIHTAGGTANFTFNAVNYRGTDDDGNAAGGGERTLPSWVTANILKDAYGYTIENPARFGTMMAVLDSSNGKLKVRGLDGSDDTIYLSAANSILTVSVDLGNDFPGSGFRPGEGNLGAWVSEFDLANVATIEIDAGSGNDVIVLDQVTRATTVTGGLGTDQLIVQGSTGYDSFTVDWPNIKRNNVNARIDTDMESIRIDTRTGEADLFLPFRGSLTGLTVQADSGDEVINLHTLSPGMPLTLFMGSGSDTVNIQASAGFDVIRSPVTVNGGDGNDTVNVVNAPVGAGALLQQPVTFNGDAGADTFNINDGNRIAANMTFNGGAGSGLDSIAFNDGAATSTVEYDIRASSVVRQGFVSTWTLNYSAVEAVDAFAGSGNDFFIVRNGVTANVGCFGNSGNDSFTFGDGLLAPLSGVVFNGGSGNDTLVFDDHAQPGARFWDVFASQVVYASTFVFATSGFEGVGILAGNGNDNITLGSGPYTQEITIDAGGGQDTVLAVSTRITKLTVRGGTDASHDFFELDDRNILYNMSGGTVYTDRISREINAPGSESNVYYAGFSSVDWRQTNNQNVITVLGVSPDIGVNNVFFIAGGTSNDYLAVYPRDAQGNPTILGNVMFSSGNDSDRLDVITTGSNPANYRLYAPTGQTGVLYVGGVGDRAIIASGTVEQINVFGGGGNDSFAVEQMNQGGALSLLGGAGDDTCTIGNGNMQATLTSASSFTFNGGDGSDRFTIANGVTNVAWTYRLQNGSLQSSQGGYSWFTQLQDIESQYVFAGSAGDIFYVASVPDGVYTELNGNAGLDGLDIVNTVTGTVKGVRGPIVYNGGADGGNLGARDQSNTTGAIVHLTANTLGAFAGDTLFGPGGSLTFSNLVNFGVFPGITLNLGTGADTIYATPLASARVEITGNTPVAAPGDQVLLGLAGVINPSVVTGSSGSVSGSNRQTLSWTGMEQTTQPIDNVAPAVVAADINVNGVPGFADAGNQQAIVVEFSENVAGLISAASLQLNSVTTGQTLPSSALAVAYNASTNVATFTFPGYPNGVLPDGNYQGRIPAGLPDFFGNALPTDAIFSFFFLNGDANRDRAVDIGDFAILAANFNRPGTFSMGDFNYSGVVEIGDFAILAARFNQSLPAAAAFGRRPQSAVDPRSVPGAGASTQRFSNLRIREIWADQWT